MKRTWFIIMLLMVALQSSNVFAQEKKEFQVADDGFEWYKTSRKIGSVKLYGAQDRNGRTIVPMEYNEIYCADAGYLEVKKNNKVGLYNTNGKCLIPYTRGYKRIKLRCEEEFGKYFWVSNDNGAGICDKDGKEIVFFSGYQITLVDPQLTTNGLFYYKLLNYNDHKRGIADANGKIVIMPRYSSLIETSGEFQIHDEKKDEWITLGKAKLLLTSRVNPFIENARRTKEEIEGHHNVNTTNTSEATKKTATKTVVVKQEREPQPMQVWMDCGACGGSGQCSACFGTGWNSLGKWCTLCNHRGVCTFCAGRGGQYHIEYR